MTAPLPEDDRVSLVYVLRLWREHPGAPWRALLRGTDAELPIGFADLNALVDFLKREMQSTGAVEGELDARRHEASG